MVIYNVIYISTMGAGWRGGGVDGSLMGGVGVVPGEIG